MAKPIPWLAAEPARDGEWFPLGELMAGLMMSFVLVAVVTVSRLDAGHRPKAAVARADKAPSPDSHAAARSPTLREAAASGLALLEQAASRGIQQADVAPGPTLREAAASGLALLEQAAFRPGMPPAAPAAPTLREALAAEFAPDLKRWHARLAPDLSVRFDQPELLFADGKPALTKDFKRVLSDFFPRYLRILSDPRFAGGVASVSIETHAAAPGGGAGAEEYVSLREMALSERRTQATLSTVLLLPETAGRRAWLAQKLVVEDLPSSEPVADGDDVDARHCVAFKLRAVENEVASEEKGKRFFFEKKNQKTL